MIISQIAAISKNYVIGKNNQLPWHLPADMHYFKETTQGHFVIMGRKNYEAEGKPLPDRTNIIITRKENFSAPGCFVFKTIDEALEYCQDQNQQEIFIIGGGEIYKQTLEITQRIYLTIIDIEIDGDVFYPKLNFDDWQVLKKWDYKKDERNEFDHTYYVLERK